jgi:hypothetical protein
MYSNAIISSNLETIRITRVSQTFSLGDCTAACCDLLSCDLAWWFEGSCYLVSCPHKENCEPKMGPGRSYLTFVLRAAQRPTQLLDYGEMMLNRGAPSGVWGDSPENIKKDLPFLGKDGVLEETAEYPDDYRELESDLPQPISRQDPKGSAEYIDWSLLPGSEGGANGSAAGHNPSTSPEKLLAPAPRGLDPELHALNESAWTPAPEHSPEGRVLLPSVTTPSSGEGLQKEQAFQLQEQQSNSSGKEVGVGRCAGWTGGGEQAGGGRAQPGCHSTSMSTRRALPRALASAGIHKGDCFTEPFRKQDTVLCCAL